MPMIPQDQRRTPDSGNATGRARGGSGENDALLPAIQASLKKVYDPEIPVTSTSSG